MLEFDVAKREEANLLIREYRPGDEEAILDSFNRVFADIDPNFHPRPMDVWRWRYRANPAGWRIWLALTEDGMVVGQQAGLPVRVLQDGQRVHWNQVGDTFTDPRFSRALRNPGLFYWVAKPYSDNYGGAPPGKDPFLYGLPTRRAHRIGARQLDYQVVRNQSKLCVDTDSIDAGAAPGIEVEEVTRFPDEVDALFDRFAEGRGAIAVRDHAFLTWRYLEHPEIRYRIALARRRGALVGLAVYRHTGFDGREEGLLVDWMVPPDDERACHAIRAWLGHCAAEDGSERLTGIFPDTCPEWAAFQGAGFRVRPSEYYMVGRVYHGPWSMMWMYWNWYYCLGDLDIV